MVERKGTDSLVVMKKHDRNPMTQEVNRRLETSRHGEKANGKHWHQRGCPGIKHGKIDNESRLDNASSNKELKIFTSRTIIN